MGDIDVVKKGSRTWLWVVIALVIALAVYFMMRGGSGPDVGSLMMEGRQPLAATSAPVLRMT